jgi:hypothetical protein
LPPRCRGSITVVKELVPADDRGRFNLEIDGVVAGSGAAVGDAGTTDTIPVTADVHRVSEAGLRGTSLSDFDIQIVWWTIRGPGKDTFDRAKHLAVLRAYARGIGRGAFTCKLPCKGFPVCRLWIHTQATRWRCNTLLIP